MVCKLLTGLYGGLFVSKDFSFHTSACSSPPSKTSPLTRRQTVGFARLHYLLTFSFKP